MHIHFCTLQYQSLAFGSLFDRSRPGQPSLTKPTTGYGMSFGQSLWMMIYQCPLDIFMLQMMVYYDGLWYFHDYQHLQALLLLLF